MKHFILLLSIFTCCCLHSQTGTLQGKVIDPNLQEGLPFASVSITVNGSLMGAQTDFDGFYEIKNIPEGTYSVSCQYIGFSESLLNEIVIAEDKITFLDIEMKEDVIYMCCGCGCHYTEYTIPLYDQSDMTTGYTYGRWDMKMR